MTRTKPKQTSEHDAKEVVKFMKFLRDKERMPLANFVARYREYMGLSEAEAAAYIAKGESRQ